MQNDVALFSGGVYIVLTPTQASWINLGQDYSAMHPNSRTCTFLTFWSITQPYCKLSTKDTY